MNKKQNTSTDILNAVQEAMNCGDSAMVVIKQGDEVTGVSFYKTKEGGVIEMKTIPTNAVVRKFINESYAAKAKDNMRKMPKEWPKYGTVGSSPAK